MKELKQAVISLSGGMDSTSLLLRLIREGYNDITAISFDYGQKHKIELEKAKELVKYLNLKHLDIKIDHHIIDLTSLTPLLVSGLVDNDSMELKKGHYSHENALTSVVPNRNAIFASISYAVALSKVKQSGGEKCIIALGTHMGDYNNDKKEGIYPDCSQEFADVLERAFKIGNWDSDKVDYYAPYNSTDKTGVLKDGVESCKKLGFNYKEIYKRTNTSYQPIKGKDGNEYSDYKTGSSVERIESFMLLNLEDPIQYVDEEGNLVDWETVTNHVKKVLEEFKKENQSIKIQVNQL